MIRLKRHRLVERCQKWFERNHPFVKLDRGQDLFPAERAKAAAPVEQRAGGEEATSQENPGRAAGIPSTSGVRLEQDI